MSATTPDDGLGGPADVPHGGLRHRLRTNPTTRLPYRIAVFAAGLLFVALGVALMALPGPLTIPPVLLGVWIWSTEFAWAERFFDKAQEQARDAWDHARRHPRTSAAVTAGGLVAAAVAIYLVSSLDLVEEARAAIGL